MYTDIKYHTLLCKISVYVEYFFIRLKCQQLKQPLPVTEI